MFAEDRKEFKKWDAGFDPASRKRRLCLSALFPFQEEKIPRNLRQPHHGHHLFRLESKRTSTICPCCPLTTIDYRMIKSGWAWGRPSHLYLLGSRYSQGLILDALSRYAEKIQEHDGNKIFREKWHQQIFYLGDQMLNLDPKFLLNCHMSELENDCSCTVHKIRTVINQEGCIFKIPQLNASH